MKDLFKYTMYAVFTFTVLLTYSCTSDNNDLINQETTDMISGDLNNENLDTATFGGGCFWCTEAIIELVEGVHSVKSGYSGGKSENPTYKEVCSGLSGHAEVVQVVYDTTKLSYVELLEIFWKTHDPTTLNRQGADKGTQYRSVIYFHNDEQKRLSEELKKELGDAQVWSEPIVTEISPYSTFYSAEQYHQNYYNDNPGQGYCSFVITPKVEKFKKVFSDKLKK